MFLPPLFYYPKIKTFQNFKTGEHSEFNQSMLDISLLGLQKKQKMKKRDPNSLKRIAMYQRLNTLRQIKECEESSLMSSKVDG